MGCFNSKEELQDTNWLCQIDDEYLNSSVSVYGLNDKVENFTKALKIIRGNRKFLETLPRSEQTKILKDSNILFGLLHARYICTDDGAEEMLEKYQNGLFGQCPRYLCHDQKLLPIGMSSDYGVSQVKLFCPSCCEVYDCDQKIDGAFFGPDFPVYFMKVHKITAGPYSRENWINSGDEKVDHRLIRWIDNHN